MTIYFEDFNDKLSYFLIDKLRLYISTDLCSIQRQWRGIWLRGENYEIRGVYFDHVLACHSA